MKLVKLTSKGLHAKLWHYTYRSVPPANLCPYFWGLILAVPLVPFRFMYDHWPHPGWEFPEGPTIPEPGRRFFAAFLAFVTVAYFLTGIFYSWLTVLAYSSLAGIGVLGFFLLHALFDYLAEKKKIPSNPFTPAAEAIGSKYHKYCPNIIWTDSWREVER